jgi:CDGSH-type Zn-finger protein
VNEATITPTDNGPYLVEGSIIVLDAEGNQYEVNGTIALCRCGQSSTKPFCDGTHENVNFEAVSRASTRAPSSMMAPAVATERNWRVDRAE